MLCVCFHEESPLMSSTKVTLITVPILQEENLKRYDSHRFLRVPAPSYDPSPSSLNSTKDPLFRLVSTISVHSITTEPDEREPPECWLPSRPLLQFLVVSGNYSDWSCQRYPTIHCVSPLCSQNRAGDPEEF